MELNDLTHKRGEWLRGSGPESDIVISSRIRLARNLADFPFISRATEPDRVQIEKTLREVTKRMQRQFDSGRHREELRLRKAGGAR